MVGRIEQGPEGSPVSVAEVKTTDGVSTTATTIYTVDNATVSGRAVVMGVNTSDSTITFVDEVLFAASGGATQDASASRGSPDGRTYSVSSDELQLSMAANSYDVTVHGLEQLPG